MRDKIGFLAILVLLAMVPGHTQSTTTSHSSTVDAARRVQELPPDTGGDKEIAESLVPISGGDLLDISVFGVPELTQQVRVSSAGEISLPLIGRVQLDGLATEQAEGRIERLYVQGGYLKAPHVSVFVREYATQGISIMGEVAKPGIYPLLGSRRLFDVISAAGGTTARAGSVVTITRRGEPNDPLTVTLPESGAEFASANVPVLPGDTVVVSRSGVVYVVGEVGKPGGYVIENRNGLTVLQAIALAQGTGRGAALNKTRLIRRTPTGVEERHIRLKDILSAKAPDVEVLPEDIVFVPSSVGKNAARRTTEAIIQVATGLVIWGGRY